MADDDDRALIMIVDDDYDFLEINRHVLEKAGYRVVTASSPDAGARRGSTTRRPALVITDLMMNDVDSGFALSRTLRADERYADIPIIMSTSVTTALGPRLQAAHRRRPRQDEDRRLLRQAAQARGACSPRSKELLARGRAHEVRRLMQIGNDGLVTTIRERCRRCFACVRECPADAIQILDGQAERHRRALHRLRQLLRRLQPERQAGLQRRREDVRPARRQRPRWRRSSRRASRPSSPTSTRACSSRCCTSSASPRCTRSPSAPTWWRASTARCSRADRRPLHRHPLPRRGLVRAQVPPRPAAYAGPDRLADDRHGARRARASAATTPRSSSSGPASPRRARPPTTRSRRDRRRAHVHRARTRCSTSSHLEPGDITEPLPFDPPRGSLGSLFPLARGLLQAADLHEDLLTADIVAADGRDNFADAIDDFAHADSDVRLLDILTCQGCIGGVGFTRDEPLYRRRAEISRHAREQRAATSTTTPGSATWRRFGDLDLSRDLQRRTTSASSTSPPDDELDGDPRAHGQVQPPRTSSTAAPAATTPASRTRSPSSTASPRSRCACPT